jgi:NMT1/THI5 like
MDLWSRSLDLKYFRPAFRGRARDSNAPSQLAGLAGGLVLALLALLIPDRCWAEEKVSLQLKWSHQFQFAGYYAALEQGFYKSAGLDVDIREGGPLAQSGYRLSGHYARSPDHQGRRV